MACFAFAPSTLQFLRFILFDDGFSRACNGPGTPSDHSVRLPAFLVPDVNPVVLSLTTAPYGAAELRVCLKKGNIVRAAADIAGELRLEEMTNKGS